VADRVMARIPGKLAAFVVWIPAIRSDRFEATREAAQTLLDPRVQHFWDGDRSLGLAYTRVIQLPAGEDLTWDVFMLYPPGVRWGGRPPPPAGWMHQYRPGPGYLDIEVFHDSVAATVNR
jgi:hypothetical protein